MPDLRKRKFKLLRKRPPAPVYPLAAQVAYASELRELLRYARALVRARVLPILSTVLEQGALDHADADPGKRVNRVLDQVSEALFRKYPTERIARIAQRAAEATDEAQKSSLLRQVRETIGVSLESIRDRGVKKQTKQFTAENVALIKTLPQRYFDETEKIVLQGIREGARHTEVSEKIRERFNVSESRANLIARDQVLKFNGSLARVRQQGLGVERYTWRTSGDNRVREDHAEREGEVYEWADPPGDPSDPATGGHPGEAINCRCYAEPIFTFGEEAE